MEPAMSLALDRNDVTALFALRPLPHSLLDAHEVVSRGLPVAALTHLVNRLAALREPAALEKALGMSIRTYQRHKETPHKPLSQEQGGRVWKFAEILAEATSVLGSQPAAEAWLAQPALALDGRVPLDLLGTPMGMSAVETLLGRMRHGVYT